MLGNPADIWVTCAGMATLTMAADKLLQIARIYYFHSLPPVILGVIYLAVTREFLINHRLEDYNTPEQLRYTRPEPCTGLVSSVDDTVVWSALLQLCLFDALSKNTSACLCRVLRLLQPHRGPLPDV